MRTWAEPSRLDSRVVLGVALVGPYRLNAQSLHARRKGRSVVARSYLVTTPCVMLSRLTVINRGVLSDSGSI